MSLFFLIATLIFCFVSFAMVNKLIKAGEAENIVDWGSHWLNRLDGINRLFCHRFHSLPKNYVDLPAEGPAIVVANHISGLDPLMLAVICKRPVRFLVAKEEYNRFGFHWIFKAMGCIPVDRKRNPERALHEALSVLKQGEVVGIFPHGGIQWPTNLKGKIKGGAVRLAQRIECPIFPVFFTGVKLKGFTLPSLFVRSNVVARFYPATRCDARSYDICMDQLAQILNQNAS